jgi:hypothetical protein
MSLSLLPEIWSQIDLVAYAAVAMTCKQFARDRQPQIPGRRYVHLLVRAAMDGKHVFIRRYFIAYNHGQVYAPIYRDIFTAACAWKNGRVLLALNAAGADVRAFIRERQGRIHYSYGSGDVNSNIAFELYGSYGQEEAEDRLDEIRVPFIRKRLEEAEERRDVEKQESYRAWLHVHERLRRGQN